MTPLTLKLAALMLDHDIRTGAFSRIHPVALSRLQALAALLRDVAAQPVPVAFPVEGVS